MFDSRTIGHGMCFLAKEKEKSLSFQILSSFLSLFFLFRDGIIPRVLIDDYETWLIAFRENKQY